MGSAREPRRPDPQTTAVSIYTSIGLFSLRRPALQTGVQSPDLLLYEWYIFDVRLVNRFGELGNGLR